MKVNIRPYTFLMNTNSIMIFVIFEITNISCWAFHQTLNTLRKNLDIDCGPLNSAFSHNMQIFLPWISSSLMCKWGQKPWKHFRGWSNRCCHAPYNCRVPDSSLSVPNSACPPSSYLSWSFVSQWGGDIQQEKLKITQWSEELSCVWLAVWASSLPRLICCESLCFGWIALICATFPASICMWWDVSRKKYTSSLIMRTAEVHLVPLVLEVLVIYRLQDPHVFPPCQWDWV